MNGLFYLAYLVRIKNEINRRRRRFYMLMNPPYRWVTIRGVGAFNEYNKLVKTPYHPAYTKREARAGYNKAKNEMKEMTAHMREIRLDIGAKLEWGSSGNIKRIILENKEYDLAEIERLADCYVADSILLG